MADFGFANKSNSSDFSSTGDKVNEVFGDLLLNRTELEAMITSLKRRQYGATPPANPNTGDIWECSTTGGGYTATVVYRYNGSAWAELIASSVNIPNRNTVIQGKVTAAGLPDLFEAGTGLAVKLNATATPAIFAFMNGNSTSLGTVDIVAAVSADAATFWSSLPTSSTVYLYVDYTAGTVSGGFTTLAPVTQFIAPTHSAGLHWLDFNTGKVWSSDGSAWTQRNRIFVGTATTDGSGVTAVSIYPYNDYKGKFQGTDIDTDGTLSADSDSKIATQKAVKSYVAANIGTVASSAEAKAGTDNTKMLTPLQLRNGLNASGNAPVYACRAWVNFNGTGTPAIRGSGNVSSITDNGTGDYTINFATAMPDINYGVSGSAQRNNTSGAIQNVSVFKGTSYAPTVSNVHVIVANASDVAEDPLMASVVIFR